VEDCPHHWLNRAGIQRFPVPPYRLYLLNCRSCGTTLSTWTLRIERTLGLRDEDRKGGKVRKGLSQRSPGFREDAKDSMRTCGTRTS